MRGMVTAEPQDPTLVGAVLSRRFRLVKKVGAGGMGAVYATDQIIDGRKVAVKLLHPEFVHEPEVKVRFLEEARTCQRLIHPNILRVFECLEAEDGTPYIVMELLEGVPLSAYTENGGRVPLAQAAVIAQGILAGLAAAHAQGIVHRDLKPENVFLANEGGAHFVVKLLDFGIAKVMDVAGGMGSKTRTGMLLGTPAYMSPEQVKNSKDVDPRSDLWSAGVMLYEMLTGRTAFPAPTEYARLFAVLNNTPEPLEAIDPQLAPLSPFILRAMDKNRDTRFQSALEMNRALTALAGQADPTSRAQPLSRLPEVGSLFSPFDAAATAATSPQAKSTFNPAAAPRTLGEPAPAKGPHGTLASPLRADIVTVDGLQPAPVILMSGGGGTLPSNDLPMLEPVTSGAPRLRRGVDPRILVALVVVALLAGFSLGFAVGRGFG
jgi:eukaryotic-like serine/threonine-protein kinase